MTTILVVDDERCVRQVIADILETPTCRVAQAPGAREALRAAAELAPELILLDLVMPEVDGVETLRRLRAHPATAHIPVIIMSGMGADQTLLRGSGLHAAGFLRKPFLPAELLRAVRQALMAGVRPPLMHYQAVVADRA